MLIDDFSRADGRSALGTRWDGFSDRVMGGRSDLSAGYREHDGQRVLVLEGQVRLDNNGGFIQVRLPLSDERADFDAGAYRGLRVTARALRAGPYYVHLRSADNRRPWSYYRARLELSEDWQAVELPFANFEPQSLSQPLDPERLRSLAIVAYGEAFEAEIEVSRIEWIESP